MTALADRWHATLEARHEAGQPSGPRHGKKGGPDRQETYTYDAADNMVFRFTPNGAPAGSRFQ